MKQSMYKSKEELPMFLTVMDVANLLGISRASAYELVREDNFPKLKIVQGEPLYREIDSSNGSMIRRDTMNFRGDSYGKIRLSAGSKGSQAHTKRVL